MSRKIKNLLGKKYGKLLVIEQLEERKNNKVVWKCKCDCGNTTNVVGTQLTNGNTKSCGCISNPHGMFGTRIYNVWRGMKERCYVEKSHSYPLYGGRGIKVCDEWQEFIPFMEWAYSNGYDESAPRGQCTIDRIDNDGDYEPSNCRWVSMSVQANNKNSNVFVEYKGVIDTISNQARRNGLSPSIVEDRRIKGKKGDDLFKDKRVARTLFYKGQYRKIEDICKMTNVSRSAIERRVIKGNEDLEYVINEIKSLKRKKIIRNRSVLQYDLEMNFLKEWENLSQINTELGYNKGAIANCCLGNTKTSNGYIWRYKKE